MESAVDKFIGAYNRSGVNFIRAAYLAGMTYTQYMRHVKELRDKKVTWIEGLRIKHCEDCGKAYIAYYKGFKCNTCKVLEKYNTENSIPKKIHFAEKHCDYCGKAFIDRTLNQHGRFCSPECSRDFHKKRRLIAKERKANKK